MKTVIIVDKNGQLGNRLFLFAHFISNSLEHNYKLYFPTFNELSKYFENTHKNRYGDYPIRSRFFKSNFLNNICLLKLKFIIAVLFRSAPATIWYRIIRLYKRHDLNIKEYSFYDIDVEEEFCKSKNILLLQGWSYRSPKSVIKHKDKVRPLFKLKKEWSDRVENFLNQNKTGCDLLIGVHARRGDYKTFFDGKYYYDDKTFRDYMLQVKSLFPEKKIRFVVTSNEKISLNKIEGCDIVYPNGHFIEDLYILAGCNYIIGPPSTYSQWASYYGNTPLRILWEPVGSISKAEEFKVSTL
jgi:hypothetical protein